MTNEPAKNSSLPKDAENKLPSRWKNKGCIYWEIAALKWMGAS